MEVRNIKIQAVRVCERRHN